jgi:hypothetical protein
MDYVDGCTFEEYIKKPSFSLSRLISIYIILSVALYQAQQHCGFLHMDLYPWNIMIKEHAFECVYPVAKNSICIKSSICPVIIDYGKSHFIHDGIHHYNSTPFHLSSIQDIVSIVFSSMYIFIDSHKLNPCEINHILKLMNFFSGSEYVNNIQFYNLTQLKSFIKKYKKYSNMLKLPKLGLENKTPLDFFHHIIKNNFPHDCKITSKDKVPLSFLYLGFNNPIETQLKLLNIKMELLTDHFELRNLWVQLEKFWNIHFSTDEETYLHYHNLNLLFTKFKDRFADLWKNITYEELMKNNPPLPIIKPFNIQPSFQLISLPTYPTHLCKHCLCKNVKFCNKSMTCFKQIFLQKLIHDLLGQESFDSFPLYLYASNEKTFRLLCQ